ncbi:hypothetical protein Plhal304r1_c019g0069611 [Plasmopara halstedii]
MQVIQMITQNLIMHEAPLKRYHAGNTDGSKPSHSAMHKKAKMLAKFHTSAHMSMLSKQHNGERHPEVSNVESEEIEIEEEIDNDSRELQSQETEDGDNTTMPLVVFQCSTCRSIFGDSYAFVCSTEQLWLVTLSHVMNVTLAPEVQTASAGFDAGSSYYELLCHNCQAVLGRRYLTTPVALDEIRDLFSFSTGAITSYTLGDPMQKGEGEEDIWMKQASIACSTAMQTLAAEQSEVMRLREEMEKVKTLMVAVDERLAHLEGSAPESDDDAAGERQHSRQA